MRCYRCMKEFDKEYEICPHCGYINTSDFIEPFQLPPGTMLQERYWIGMMIGLGGFGITYKAYDTKLNVTVAIKEYYPAGLVNRVSGTTIVQNDFADREKEFNSGLERFIEEARNIAKFSEHPNIVKVYHFFRENHTGYIVMEYLDGITMRYFLEVNGEKTSILYAKEIVLAVAQALQALHRAGILHRDISPDNIFLCSDGKIKLIDFGSSRLSKAVEDNLDIIVKHGYAPPEQYQKDGNQGTWTDIYALGATFYRAVTGQTPQESVERQREDLLQSPRECNLEVPAYIDAAILKAMALDVKERFERVDDFINVLLEHKVVAIPKSKKKKRENRQKIILSLVGTLMLAAFGGLLFEHIRIRQNGYVADEIEVWICAKENEDAAAVEAYYQEINKELLADDYEDLTIHIHIEEESVYEDRLKEAFLNGTAPDIFDSTFLEADDEFMTNAVELEDCLMTLEQSEGEAFVEKYEACFFNGKRIPMGFDIPVVYTLQPESMAQKEGFSLADFDEQNIYDSISDMQKLQQFADGKLSYLCADMTDYNQVKEAVYGTFEQPKGQLAGLLRVLPLEDGENQLSFTTTFSVNKASSAKERKTAYLYLQYLLSYKGQVLMHIPVDNVVESNALPVHSEADKECMEFVEDLVPVLEEKLQ